MIFSPASHSIELKQILQLQSENLEQNISRDQLLSEGFVTVQHNLRLLQEMNIEYPHIVAKDGDKIIGYALVMTKSFSTKIPVLVSMFDMINKMQYENVQLESANYFVMGQICIEKKYRGRGVFKGLYETLRNQMKRKFDYIITEVASRNTRSLKAHFNIGFKSIAQYYSELNEEWHILILKI